MIFMDMQEEGGKLYQPGLVKVLGKPNTAKPEAKKTNGKTK